MNRKELLCFVGGFLLGASATYIYGRIIKKTAVEKNMTYEDGFVPVEDIPVEEWREDREQTETDYSKIVDDMYNHDPDSQGVTHYAPYTISPEDYDDESYEDYEKETLTYYADGILARINDEIIRNPEEVVGPNALGYFAAYKTDVVYVRDDSDRIQYEIDRDSKKYSEVVGPIPDDYDDE